MLFFLIALWASVAAADGPRQLSLPVGHTMTLAMPNRVASVRVDDPGLVEVKTSGRHVTLVARTKGTTQAVVRTVDGEHRFRIYVAADKYALPY